VSAALGFDVPLERKILGTSVDGLYSRRDGYFHNLTLDSHPDERETMGGRVQLHWSPLETLDLTAAANLYEYDDGALVARPIEGWTDDWHDLRQDYDGFNKQTSQTYSLRAALRSGEVRAVNVLAYRFWDQDLSGDFDFSPSPMMVGYDRPDLQQWSEEFRVEQSDPDFPWRWSVGFFASGREVDRENGFIYGSAWQPPFLPPLAGMNQVTVTESRDLDLAVFGQLTWSPVEQLDLTVGLRSEFDERQMHRRHLDPTQPPNYFESDLEDNYRSVQPKLGVGYRFTDSVEAWLTGTTGYQPGGFSPSVNDPADAAYDPAQSMHLELGISGKCWEDRLVASVGLFWTETSDYQVYRPVSLTSFEVVNADRVRVMGAEAGVRYQPVKGLDFRVSAGFNHAEFTDFETLDPSTGQPLDLSGNQVNFVPELTLNGSLTYRFDFGLYGTVGGSVVGRTWFDELNTREQPLYGLLNARVGWSRGSAEVAVFGRNLLGEESYANAMDLGPTLGYVGTPGDPLLLGVEGAVRF